MTKEKGYNGWTNYETWAVNLWIREDQGAQEYWRGEAGECLKSPSVVHDGQSVKDAATNDLMQKLDDEYTDNIPVVTGMYADLLRASLRNVNWHEIAAHMIEEHKDSE